MTGQRNGTSRVDTAVADTVVVGGGPAGAATARALALSGCRVLLVEPGGGSGFRIGESVPPDLRPVLQRLELLDGFLAERHDPCLGSVSCWGDDRPGYNDFLLNPNGHGWHLDRRRFDTFLREAATAAGAEIRYGARLTGTRETADGLHLTLSDPDGTTWTALAGFAVDATGLSARLARVMGARRRYDDRLICLSATFNADPDLPMARLTRLEAADCGWWYAARLPHGRLVVALTTDAATLRRLRLGEPEPWRRRLLRTDQISRLLPYWPTPDGLHRDAAPSARLDPVAGRRWLAVGDAALAFDPIMSEGIHKALANGVAAAQVIGRLRAGDPDALAAYARHVARRHRDYLDTRQQFYDLERRWPQAPFWQARHSPAPPVPGPDVRAAGDAAARA